MTQAQLNLLMQRFIKEPQKYNGIEPANVKEKNDRIFCEEFFGCKEINHAYLAEILTSSINANDELALDLLLMLLSHFRCVNHYCVTLAPLLIQPWHHLHDRVACVLEFESDERIIEFLYQGSMYRCDNLEYESDYCEFNRKCLFALAKIGTQEAIKSIKNVSKVENPIIANHALKILEQYGLT